MPRLLRSSANDFSVFHFPNYHHATRNEAAHGPGYLEAIQAVFGTSDTEKLGEVAG